MFLLIWTHFSPTCKPATMLLCHAGAQASACGWQENGNRDSKSLIRFLTSCRLKPVLPGGFPPFAGVRSLPRDGPPAGCAAPGLAGKLAVRLFKTPSGDQLGRSVAEPEVLHGQAPRAIGIGTNSSRHISIRANDIGCRLHRERGETRRA
jgi:hypothetical protein